MNEGSLGKELYTFRPSMVPIEQISINFELKKVAIASMGFIKFYNTTNWIEESQDRIDV
jgi:hypothetical protein